MTHNSVLIVVTVCIFSLLSSPSLSHSSTNQTAVRNRLFAHSAPAPLNKIKNKYDEKVDEPEGAGEECAPSAAGGAGACTYLGRCAAARALTALSYARLYASETVDRESHPYLEPRLESRVIPKSEPIAIPDYGHQGKNKRQASLSLFDEESTCSDSTIVGSDNESENLENVYLCRGKK
ncbi:hypothetical protein EVAR_24414_1 [Eumeta japonica]|uniref:Uncharacterized protein n=1 Tax=Eumeta variegata TaxID=151549 RepID=A0A4C1VUJ5_EUMVA|nr:hypothetical protein EVAR_24414_1 [Eumeta japonica]